MKNEFDYLNDVRVDFSKYTAKTLTEQERVNMKNAIKKGKNKSARKYLLLAACICAVAVTGTAFASGFLKTITTGYNTYVQDTSDVMELPEELKGKLFDGNGIMLDSISKSDMNNIYDENGNKLTERDLTDLYISAMGLEGKVNIDDETNTIIEDEDTGSEFVYSSLEEARKSSSFNIKVPQYLPEGFIFSRAYTYKEDDGSGSGDYLTIEYTDNKGREISILERTLNEQTKFTMCTDGKIEEITINGMKAVLSNNKNIDFETSDNVSVALYGYKGIDKNELIKTAESIE